MGESSVLSEINEEVVRSCVDTLSLETSHELIKIINTHGATGDLTDVGHENINGLGDSGIVSTLLHVEGLDLQRESGEEHGDANLVGHLSLSSLGDIVAKLELLAILVGDVVFVEPLDSVNVGHSHEGSSRSLEAGVKLLDKRASNGVGEDVLNGSTENLLNVLEEGLKVEETELGLNMGVLGKMSSGVRSLGSERLGDTVGVTDGGDDGLEVELRRLCEVGLLSVVVEGEKSGTTLNLGLDHAGGSDFGHSNLVVDSSDASQEGSSHLHDGRQSLASKGQVSVVEQVRGVSALLDLVGDGVVAGGSEANDLVEINHKLVSTGGSGTLGDLLEGSVDGDRRLEGEVLGLEGVGEIALEHALEVAGSVSEHEEGHALLGSQSVDPSERLDSRSSVLGGISDLDHLGLGERLVLGDDNLLGSLESGSLGSITVGLGGLELLGLFGLLDESIDTLLGLLESGRRNVLVGTVGTLDAGLEDLDLGIGVGVESVSGSLEGGLLGAVGGGVVLTLCVVDVDCLSRDSELLYFLSEVSHFGVGGGNGYSKI